MKWIKRHYKILSGLLLILLTFTVTLSIGLKKIPLLLSLLFLFLIIKIIFKKAKWADIAILLLLILLTFAFILYYIENIPFVFIGAEIFLILIYITVKTKKSENFKALTFNLAIIVLTLTIAEAHFAGLINLNRLLKKSNINIEQKENKKTDINQESIKDIKKEGAYYSGGYVTPDEIRGYAGKKNVTADAKVIINGEVIYDVIYTTNKYGLRIMPHDIDFKIDRNYKNILFFGCSFTVGEGVNDNEAMPALFEVIGKGKYKAYNFGFHGYGPHQMLRLLESEMVNNIVNSEKPIIAVYTAVTPHIERSSFNITWGENCPKYDLDKNGNAIYKGNGNFILNSKTIDKIVRKSHLIKAILPFYKGWKRTEKDIELFIAIVKRSKEIIENKYNGKFYVIYWDKDTDPDTQKIISLLQKNNIEVFKITEILDFINNPIEMYQFKLDNHPTKIANKKIAEYLINKLK